MVVRSRRVEDSELTAGERVARVRLFLLNLRGCLSALVRSDPHIAAHPCGARRITVKRLLACGEVRFAARSSGLASGLALAVRPAGSAEVSGAQGWVLKIVSAKRLETIFGCP